MVKSILNNQNSILTASTYIDNFEGIKDVFFSLPCIVNKNGIDKIIQPLLSLQEYQTLKESAKVIKVI
ncbi:MAG TPA: hypothetical protein GXZ27_08880 [Thermoanaerobacterales bacterium]|nr:hypothetical protein [Thermoanaerobacterales bacterium]